jgi:hypothetical protein
VIKAIVCIMIYCSTLIPTAKKSPFARRDWRQQSRDGTSPVDAARIAVNIEIGLFPPEQNGVTTTSATSAGRRLIVPWKS